MKTSNLYFAGVLALFLGLSSCNKDETRTAIMTDSDLLKTSTVIDYANESDFQTGMETASDNSALRSSFENLPAPSTCPTVTVVGSGDTFPKIFTLDFGSGCTNNGITRSGKLTITLTDYLLDNGSQMTIARNNYYINGYKVEGDVVYVNQTTDPAVPQWTRTVASGQITTPEGNVYEHSGTRVVKQTAGVNTVALLDNVFEISEGSAVVSNGTSTLTATIISPLIKKASCIYISQGVLNLQGSYLNGNLNYGNNQCDDLAVYTHSDGNTYTVHL